MDIRFFTRFTLYSFVALVMAWLISSVLVAIMSGNFIFSELVAYANLVLSFVIIAWSAFIFPFMHLINKLLLIQIWRIYFSLIAMVYGVCIYALVLTIFTSFNTMWNALFTSPLAFSAGLIGGIWGLTYEILYVYERRRKYTN